MFMESISATNRATRPVTAPSRQELGQTASLERKRHSQMKERVSDR
jgi:hypothetical protein